MTVVHFIVVVLEAVVISVAVVVGASVVVNGHSAFTLLIVVAEMQTKTKRKADARIAFSFDIGNSKDCTRLKLLFIAAFH